MATIRFAIWFLLIAIVMVAVPAISPAAVFLSVSIAPPVLPVYAQPVCPGDGFIWVPGYWAYGPGGYYWVPGAWVLAPFVGALWTPGYWGWRDNAYFWNTGYWGYSVGFYGGINYGFGYLGSGYVGGYWSNRAFHYNRAVNNVNLTRVRNVYNKTVVNNTAVTCVSYHGGAGGTTARPTRAEMAAARGWHRPATTAQTRLQQTASTSRPQAARVSPRVSPSRAPAAATPRTRAGSGLTNAPRNTAQASRPISNGGTPRAAHSNTRIAPATRQRAEARGQHVPSTVRNAPLPHTGAGRSQYNSRSVGAPRSSAPRAHSMAPARPAPAQRPSPRPVHLSGPVRNQSLSAPRSHGASPLPGSGEKRKG